MEWHKALLLNGPASRHDFRGGRQWRTPGYLVVNTNTPSHASSGGLARNRAILSR